MPDNSFPSGSHPLRFSKPGQDGPTQTLSHSAEGEITNVNGGGEMQSWGDFALQNQLHKEVDEDEFHV